MDNYPIFLSLDQVNIWSRQMFHLKVSYQSYDSFEQFFKSFKYNHELLRTHIKDPPLKKVGAISRSNQYSHRFPVTMCFQNVNMAFAINLLL